MTKLAMSNIAWEPQAADIAYRAMAEAGLSGLEIAPGLAFPEADDPFAPTAQEIGSLRQRLRGYGLKLVSMQSLLFSVKDAQLFGSADERAALDHAMRRAIELAERLEIPVLVFGSPSNRSYPVDMGNAEALEFAKERFCSLGDVAQASGTRLAIEPNPADYGTNFLNSVEETAHFVNSVDHPAIAFNFDLGALTMNGEQEHVSRIVDFAFAKLAHVHVSSPDLAPAPQDIDKTSAIIAALRDKGYGGFFSIEMRRVEDDEDLATATRCMNLLAQAARDAARDMGHA